MNNSYSCELSPRAKASKHANRPEAPCLRKRQPPASNFGKYLGGWVAQLGFDPEFWRAGSSLGEGPRGPLFPGGRPLGSDLVTATSESCQNRNLNWQTMQIFQLTMPTNIVIVWFISHNILDYFLVTMEMHPLPHMFPRGRGRPIAQWCFVATL